MYIRRIIICGFKSYKKKVVLDLSPGHNVVVGANGSGKSNIYAALEFVLSSKYDMLRSEQRKQLLHDAGQSGVVSAFVEIIFDNEDGRFPINETLISIKRTIGAKKDEYFVNQRHFDKTELNNLLESAGISKYNQHFIVPQGQIAERVKERDNERLKLIKEIAGTRVYDERRNESIKLMGNADNKREKVKMVIEYFDERLAELGEEKEELAKFEKLDSKRRSVEYQIYDKERMNTQTSLDKLEESEGKTDEKNEELHGELKEMRQEIDEYKSEKISLEKKLDRVVSEVKHAQKELQSTERLIVSLQSKNKSLQKDNKDYKGKKAEYEQQMKEVEREIKKCKGTLSEISEEFEGKRGKEMELRAELKRNESRIKDLYSKQQRLGQYKSKSARNKKLKAELNELNEEISEQKKLCKEIKTGNDGIDQKIKQLSAQLNKLEREQVKTEKLFEKTEKIKDTFKTRRNKCQNDRKKFWKELNDLNKGLEECKTDKQKFANDFRYTMNLNQYLSYTQLKRIQNDILQNGADSRYKLSGQLYGAVIENFTVIEDKYNIAVEAAASNKLFYYLVENDTVASELITIMQRERINRVTFIPLNRCHRFKERKYPKGSADVIPIMKLLRYDDNIENIRGALIQIFGNTLIPHDLSVGYEYAHRDNYQCVTLAGDIVTSRGAMDGGFNTSKYRRLRCYNKISNVEREFDGLTNDKNECERKLERIQAKLLEIENKMRENENEASTNRNLLSDNKERLIEIEEEIESEEGLRGENLKIFEKHEQNINRIQNSAELIETEMKQPLKKKLSAEERKEIEDLSEEIETVKDSLAQAIKDTGEIEMEKTKLMSLLKDNLNMKKKDLSKKIKKCNESYGNDAKIDNILNKLEMTTEKRDKMSQEIVSNDKSVESWNKRLKIIDKELSKLQKEEQELTLEIEEHSISCETLLGKHQALREKLDQFIKYIKDLGALTSHEINKYKKKSISSLNNTLKQVKKDLVKYQSVNKKALNQYNSFLKEKKKLHSRNEQQLTDKDHIERLMQHLDLKKDDAILRTFNAINTNFKQAFKELVVRGNAKLTLFEHENKDEIEMKDTEEDDDEYTQSQSQRQSQRNRRRRSSNLSDNHNRRNRNRRKSSMAMGSQSYDIFEEFEDKKYAGIGIRVSFGEDMSQNSDGESEEEERARDMRQLSGGQQTVVALALIFAIQRCDPSPFYVFDEIDAALDQQYRKAVADIIGGMKSKTQFITTTFRPEILQEADKCFVVDFKAKISTVKDVNPHEVDITKFT